RIAVFKLLAWRASVFTPLGLRLFLTRRPGFAVIAVALHVVWQPAANDETHLHFLADNRRERAHNSAVQPVLQPVARVIVAHADDEGAIVAGQQARVLQPGVEGRLRHL